VSLVTFLGTSIVIGMCLLVTWGFSELKDQQNQKLLENEDTSATEWAGIRILTTLSSLVIVMTNKSLLKVVVALSNKERHMTLTNLNLSIATKLASARFINSALVPIVVNFGFEEWFVQGGLAQDVSYLILFISIGDPILAYLDVFWFLRLFKRWK